MPDEAVKKQIEGICQEISEKKGWTSFAIDVGTKYPVRLSTKLPALIEQGRAAGSQRAVWTFKESQGGENPNQPGTYYTNRYLDHVEVGGSLTETMTTAQHAAASSAAPAGGARTGATNRSIERQVILKEMVQHYPGFAAAGGMTVAEWWALMAALDAFMVDGVSVAMPEVAVDDDIPFE